MTVPLFAGHMQHPEVPLFGNGLTHPDKEGEQLARIQMTRRSWVPRAVRERFAVSAFFVT